MKSLLLFLTLTLTTTSFAGPGGGHSHSHGQSKKEVSKAETKDLAKKEVDRLVKIGKLDASWNNAIYATSEKKTF